jgi:hypothetical protein
MWNGTFDDLEILQSCPDTVSVGLGAAAEKLFRQLERKRTYAEVKSAEGLPFVEGTSGRADTAASRRFLQPRAELVLPGSQLLEKSAHATSVRCPLRTSATEGLPWRTPCTVAIRQLYEGVEVGRVTWSSAARARIIAGRFHARGPVEWA